METLEFVLSPIIWVMLLIYDVYFFALDSAGAAILAVSATFSVIMMYFRRRAEAYELELSAKMQAINAELSELKGDLKGEALFNVTEKVYERHGYHPIQSVGMGASFLVMLPVLLSAWFIFSNDAIVGGHSFMFVSDLSMPDGLLGPVNLLPLVMSSITIVDARMRFKDDSGAQYRFYAIAAVLLILVHGLAAGLVLYWIGSNLFALALARIRTLRAEPKST